MKRRFLAMLLALAMLCPMILAGCSSTGDDTDDAESQSTTTRTPVSINMWIVTDKNTTPEAQAAVEEEFNRITKSTYTTNVDLVFVSPEEYVTKLNEKIALVQEAQNNKNNNASVTDTSEVTDEYVTNEYGVSELKYPEILDSQLDIVYIEGFDQLYDLATAGHLLNLNEHIAPTGKAKVLTDVIPSQLFTYTKIDKATYGIPNNRVVGNYTYLLVKKDVVTGDANGDGVVSNDEISGSYYNFSDIATFFDCEKVIEYVKSNRTDLVPVLESFDNPYIHYWSEDGSFSVLGSKKSFVSQASDFNTQYYFNNIFSVPEFVNFELMMKKFDNNGYFATDAAASAESQNFAVAVMTGDSAILDKYSDNYYIKVIANPTVTDDNLFTSFYGISSYCKDVTRALEIITMINTNSELRNVLQYGVEGVHYELDDDNRVVRLQQSYIMDLEKTGNVFIAYPEEDMADDVWERGVKTNLDITVSPLTGLWANWLTVDTLAIEDLAAYSATIKERMDQCNTVEELQAFFDEAKAEVPTNPAYVSYTNTDAENSPKSIYLAWFQKLWPSGDI